ncbi:MAG: MarR family transcriptional regulator [Clostridia bacterium]|nr:MarR family transcriptional regulator [Clostridia bacterium]
MFQLDDCVAYIINKSAKQLSARLEKKLMRYNVTRIQWTAMYYVENNQCLTQKCLADKMSLKEPTVARLLDRMEADGLIEREFCTKDKRAKTLKLTEKGKYLNKKLTDIAETFKDDAIKGIKKEDLITFKKVVEQMLINTTDQEA